jgi:hypothetical protein
MFLLLRIQQSQGGSRRYGRRRNAKFLILNRALQAATMMLYGQHGQRLLFFQQTNQLILSLTFQEPGFRREQIRHQVAIRIMSPPFPRFRKSITVV